MRMDFLVRVRDEKDKLAAGSDPVFAPAPVMYVPPPPPPQM